MSNTRYLVSIPDSMEDTSWLIDAETLEAAADQYVAAALSETISVDIEEMEDAGSLQVRNLPVIGATARVIDWSEVPERTLSLEGIPSWDARDASDPGLGSDF